jgi:RHS repeat-associated protein
LLVLFVLLAVVESLFAQADIPNPNNYGTPVSGVFSGSAIDSVNLTTGDLHIDIPLLDLPGIGQNTHIHYVYDNRVWNQTGATQPSGQWWITLYQDRQLWKFQDAMQAGVTVRTHSQTYSPCPLCGTGQAEYIDYVSFEDGSGTSHQFPINGFPQNVPVGGTVPSQAYSLDSSGYLVNINRQGTVTSVIDKDGTKYTSSLVQTGGILFTTKTEDSNGNQISGSMSEPNEQSLQTETLTDTVGRTITSIWNWYGDATGCCGPIGSVQSVSYTDQNGNPQAITIKFKPVQINLSLLCPQGDTGTCGPLVGVSAGMATAQLPGSIILQNGDTYTFVYEPNGLGEISSITLPTGGVISYTWSTAASQDGRTLSARTLTTNGQSSKWQFKPGTGNTLVVTDPDSNDTVYTCTYYTPMAGIVPSACYMTEEDFYSGSSSSGTLIATKKTAYTLTGSVMPTSTTFKWNQTGQVTETDTTWESIPYSGFNNNGGTDNAALDVSRGNRLSQMMYDYGAGSHGNLLRNTQYNYLHLQNSAYLGPNIADRISQVSIYNCSPASSSCLVAQTTTAYDQFNQSSVDGQGSLNPTTGTTQHDYTNYSTSQTVRGLATSISRYVGSSSGSVTTYTNYNDLGNPTVTTDGFDTASRSTKYTYGGQNAFVSAITLPSTGDVSHVLHKTYDINTGLLMNEKDQNSYVTSYTYDARMRLHTVQSPDGGLTTITHDSPSYPIPNVVTQVLMCDGSSRCPGEANGQTKTVVDLRDGLDRSIQSEEINDPEGVDNVVTTYDALGRKQSVSNPYRSTKDPSYGITSYSYDALGRMIYQCQPDNNSTPSTTCVIANGYVQWSYSGNAIGYYDETRRHWHREYDALGRLTKVQEPDASNNTTIETDYQYDAMSDLVRIDQWGGAKGASGDRVRTFTYDGLSRLLCASNPETSSAACPSLPTSYTSGTTGFSYDANGNVKTRTDARGITTTYSYDELNRLTWKHYSDATQFVSFSYDGKNEGGEPLNPPVQNAIGRLSHISNEINASSNYSYDGMGRLAYQSSCTPSDCTQTANPISAVYDLAGNLTQLTYPDDRVVNQTWNGAGHLITVTDTSYHGQNVGYQYMLPLSSYRPNGTPMGIYYGNGAANGWYPNDRLQLVQHGVTRLGTAFGTGSGPGTYSGNVGLFNKQYCYGPSVSAPAPSLLPCPNFHSKNNGNILQIPDPLNGVRAQTFTYDNLNRLASFTNGDGSMHQSYTIDPWGNLTQSGTLSFTPTYGTNNQISASDGAKYDAAGNLTSFNSPKFTGSYVYDAESRITNVNSGGATYVYDAEGKRVRKNAGGAWTEYLYFNGQPIAEKNSDGSWSDYIFANGQRIARADNFDIRIFMQGTNCSDCGSSPNMSAAVTSLTAANGYKVRGGDVLAWRQYQNGSADGGLYIYFTDGTDALAANDSDGELIGQDITKDSWHVRTVDLSAYAGKTIKQVEPSDWSGAPAGNWKLYFGDITLVSTDGSFIPIYSRSVMILTSSVGSGVSAFSAITENYGVSSKPLETTTYYHGDQIGSTRLVTSATGWPVSSDTYYPFGQGPQSGHTHYLYTGKERDAESGLDYFGARYYASATGRFLSPDWSEGPDPIPNADFDDPQSLNLYSYVLNNPLNHTDPSGHVCIAGIGNTCAIAPDPCNGIPNCASVTAKSDELAWWDLPGHAWVGFGNLMVARTPKQAVTGAGQIFYAYSTALSAWQLGAGLIAEEGLTTVSLGELGFGGKLTSGEIDAVVESAAEATGKGSTAGKDALQSHASRGGPFKGMQKADPGQVIRNILNNPSKVVTTTSKAGNRYLDVFSSSSGGVRIEAATGKFVTFLSRQP